MIIWKNDTWGNIIIDDNLRKNHLHILWKSGSWKTKLLYNMIMQDIQNNNWIIMVDIHWDLAENVIKNIPENRKKDLIIFYPKDIETIKNIFGLEKIFLEWKILVCNISLWQFWHEIWKSFINILLENIKQAMFSVWKENKKKTYIYIDEFQKFQTENMLALLFEGWNYYEYIWIIFVHQYLDQLSDEIFTYRGNNISLRDYILKIVPNKIIFAIWKYDSETLLLDNMDLLKNEEFLLISWDEDKRGNL